VRRLFGSVIYIGAACAIAPSTALLAQNPSAPATAASAHKTHWCFRGRPRPTCDVFVLTEFGFAANVTPHGDESGGPYDSGGLYTEEIGWMMNRGTRAALGVAGFLQQKDGGYNSSGAGIRPRLRWWISRSVSLDLAPGIFWYRWGTRPRFTGHVGLNVGDVVALTAHVVEGVPGPPDDPGAPGGGFIGARAGSALGTLLLVCVAGLYVALSGDDS